MGISKSATIHRRVLTHQDRYSNQTTMRNTPPNCCLFFPSPRRISTPFSIFPLRLIRSLPCRSRRWR